MPNRPIEIVYNFVGYPEASAKFVERLAYILGCCFLRRKVLFIDRSGNLLNLWEG